MQREIMLYDGIGPNGRPTTASFVHVVADDRLEHKDTFCATIYGEHPTSMACDAMRWSGSTMSPDALINRLRQNDTPAMVVMSLDTYKLLKPYFDAPAIPCDEVTVLSSADAA